MKKIVTAFILSVFCSFSYGDTLPDTKTIPIGNENIQKENIDDVELYAIFTLMFHYWDNGTKIHVFLLSDIYGLHKDFLWEFLGLSPIRYAELIDSKVASGRANKPVNLSSEKEMVKVVSQTRGGIGYVGRGKFIIPDGENNVKEIKIIFK